MEFPILFLPIAAAVVIAILVKAFADTKRVRATVGIVSKKAHLPRAIGMLMVVAQVSELARVVEHTTVVHVLAALLLLVIWFAARTGSEFLE